MRKNNLTYLSKRDRAAIVNLVEDLNKHFGEEFVQIKLFGSKIRGEETPESDIDVLIIVREETWELKHALLKRGARLSMENDVLFNLHIIGLERWEWMKKIRFPLYRSIVEDEVEIEFASK